MTAFRYDVFLSYRHKPLDAEVTQKTFRFLESYRLPGSLEREGHRGVRRVFRDTEELPVSRILSSTIEEALRDARCLVVICSHDTPSSEWVDREVATFIELGKAESVYPLLIDGTPEISFPPSLKKIPGAEERMMDVRTPEGTAQSIMKRAQTALLRVVAQVAEVPEEDLVREEHLRRKRTVRFAAGAAAALVAFVVAVSGGLWMKAESYRQVTAREQQAAMEVLERLTYGLPDRLVEQPGLYPKVAEILSDNADQIQRILELSPQSDDARYKVAVNKEKLATALLKLGSYDTSEASEKEAIGIYETLAGGQYPGSSLALASAKSNLGNILTAEGKYQEAAALYQTALDAIGDGDAGLRAPILGNLGRCQVMLGQYEEAASSLEECRALLEQGESTDYGEDASAVLTEAQCDLNLGLAKMQLTEYGEAEELLRRSSALYDAVAEDYRARTVRINALHADSALADCLTRQGRTAEAEEVFEKAIRQAETLAEDETNTEAQLILGELCNNYALCLNQEGRFAEADTWYRRYAAIQEAAYAAASTPQAAARLAQAYYNIAENAFKSGDYDTTSGYFRRCLDLLEPVSEQLGNYQRGEYLARLAYYEIIVERDYKAAEKAALEAYEVLPDSEFVLYNLGYALLMAGREDEADRVFTVLASLGEGALQSVTLDFEAMEKADIYSPHMPEVLQMMEDAARQG